MEFDVTLIERLGSFGLLGWLVVWVVTKAWPKISSHLDNVSDTLRDVAKSMTSVDGRLEHIEQKIEVIETGRAQTCKADTLTRKPV